jgi:hypothetical protein
MNLKKLVLGFVAVATLAISFAASVATAEAASLQRFWVVNFTDMNIYYVYVNNDYSKDLMGDNGVLKYNPHKVPDLVQVLKPHRGNCNALVEIQAGYNGSEYTAYKRVNLCKTGQTINVRSSDFN